MKQIFGSQIEIDFAALNLVSFTYASKFQTFLQYIGGKPFLLPFAQFEQLLPYTNIHLYELFRAKWGLMNTKKGRYLFEIFNTVSL